MKDYHALDYYGKPMKEEPTKDEKLAKDFHLCAALAKNHQPSALSNPSTYKMFAMAMYLDEWDWSYGGIAQEIKS